MRSGCAAAARGSRAGETKLIVIDVRDIIQVEIASRSMGDILCICESVSPQSP